VEASTTTSEVAGQMTLREGNPGNQLPIDVADGAAHPDLLISANISLGAGINKTGAGSLFLNGTNTYTGPTTINAGTLGGTGSVTSNVTLASGTTLAPGTSVGTFTVTGDVTIDGALDIEVDGATADQLVVSGTLDIDGAVVDFIELAAPTASSYLIASAASITGTATFTNIPTGYDVTVSATEIKLALPGTPFELWIENGTFANPGLLATAADKLPGADPDGDGKDNFYEFALDGDPTDPADNGKMFMVIDDGDDGDADDQLMVTLAVRSGASFAGTPSPTATIDGVIYTVGGSLTLADFTAPVSVESVAIPPAGAPAPNTGWEYRSFSLDGSNNLPGAGFLRVEIVEEP
jgi:autotransporter-associated beta strand protein